MCMDDGLNDTFLVSDSDSVDFLPIHEEHTDCKLSIISRRDIFFILSHMVLSLQYAACSNLHQMKTHLLNQ